MMGRMNKETLDWLDALGREGSIAGMSDGELLGRFLEKADAGGEAAFEALVRRLGPKVLAACRGILPDPHDADDAFQATFIVLARRAATVRDRDRLEMWLGRVARRIAQRARRDASRREDLGQRRAVEDIVAEVAPAQAGLLSAEEASLVRAEVERLPESDRLLMRLTYWQGRTYEEAAAMLSWPIGTVRSRLSRARRRLQGRLARLGLAPAVASAGSATLVEEASAAVSDALVVQTVRAACGRAGAISAVAEAGTVSASVAAMVDGELAVFTTLTWKSAAALLLVGGTVTVAAGVVSRASRPSPPRPIQAAAPPEVKVAYAAAEPKASPIDHEAWAKKLAALNDAEWRVAAAVGAELAALPPDDGFAILAENWEKITKVGSRQQLLKAWAFARPDPRGRSRHPRLLDGLDLGMRDRSPEVQQWSISYLGDITFQDFSEDFAAYKAWYQANRGKPLPDVVAGSARRLATEADHASKAEAPKLANWIAQHAGRLREVPEARKAALDAGLLKTLERWLVTVEAGASREEAAFAAKTITAIGLLKPGEIELRRLVVPRLAEDRPVEVRTAAASALEGEENAWAVDLLLDNLKASLDRGDKSLRIDMWTIAGTLASIGDPRAIPTMIAVIDADNTYDTVYGVGYFGLGRLIGVSYDASHDGTWWRGWWGKNKERYPEDVRSLEIPRLTRKPRAGRAAAPSAEDPLADVADVPSEDLRAGGDERKRYFLIGSHGDRPPASGYGLVVVLPGGDGSADFQPFLRRVSKNVLKSGWLIAEAVAPKWDDAQFDRVVWPTAASGYPAAKFTTEEFIRAIVADVRGKVAIDPRRILVFGWSSGGPPSYAAALAKDTPVTGAFIAMSVFPTGPASAIEPARNKPFYLLQSPADQVTPLHHAEAAEKALRAAGARVHLQHYGGGHGWRGDVWAMISDGITWLDRQVETK